MCKDPYGTGRRLVVLHWVKPYWSTFVCSYEDKIIGDHLQIGSGKTDSTALLSFNWALDTPLECRTSPLVETKNWHICMSSWNKLADFVSKTCQGIPRVVSTEDTVATRKEWKKKFFSLQQINVRKLLQSSGYLRFKINCLGKIAMHDSLGAILSALRFLNNEFPLMSSLQY